MSHFVVLVIGNDYEGQLEPFMEQDNNPENNPYFVFKNMSEEGKEEYEEKSVELIDYLGKVFSKYDDQFYKQKEGSFERVFVLPEGATLRTGAIKEVYPDFEDYLENYCGYSYDEDHKAYGYWHNPNAKWDWYQVGGRWTGYFKLKDGRYGLNGEPGLMTSPAKEGWADSVLISDIDIDGMKEDAQKTANETYDKVEQLLKGRQYPVWSDILKSNNDNVEAARVEFRNHPVVKDFDEARFHVWGEFEKEYGYSREAYVEKCMNSVMVPFAVLKDGKWYERGRMGWWAMVSDEMEQDDWNTKFQQLIADLPKDTLVTAVDCHI